MFSDKYGLTQSVLDRRKTNTRRIISKSLWNKWTEYDDLCNSIGVGGLVELGVTVTREYSDCEKFFLDNSPFKVGEIVAIAQSYKDAGVIHIPCEDDEFGCYDFPAEQTNGWTNKMFVRAGLMPHQIRFNNHKVEQLQDISDEDCIKEGIEFSHKAQRFYVNYNPTTGSRIWLGDTPREAYAALIDLIAGKGTWGNNPYVFSYDFELVKQ